MPILMAFIIIAGVYMLVLDYKRAPVFIRPLIVFQLVLLALLIIGSKLV